MKKCAPRLNDEQIWRLESIGFEWSTSKGMTAWENKFELLKKYVSRFGNARVPTELDTPEFPKLGGWVAMQRQSFRNEEKRAKGETPKGAHRIRPGQIQMLDSIGFHWQVGNRENRGWKKNLAVTQESTTDKSASAAAVPVVVASSASNPKSAVGVVAVENKPKDEAPPKKRCAHACMPLFPC